MKRRGAADRGLPWVLIGLLLLTAVVVALLVPALSAIGALVVGSAGIGSIAIVVLRRRLRVSSATSGRIAVSARTVGGGDAFSSSRRDLRWSRLAFYLGTATIAESSFRVVFGLTLSELFFLGALTGCVFGMLRGHSIASLPLSLTAGVGLFALGGAISSPGASSPTGSMAEVIHGVYVMLLWAWVAAMVLRSREQLTTAIVLWAVSGAVDGFGAVTQVLGIHALAGQLQASRATGFTTHPNDLGGATAIALVPCLLLTARSAMRHSMAARLLPWTLLTLTASGIVLSASVSAMAAALGAIVVWFTLPSVRTPGRIAVVAALASSLIVLIVVGGGVTSPAQRLSQVTSPVRAGSNSGSGQIRIQEVKTAWPRIEANPVVGTGLDTSDSVVTVSIDWR